VTIPFGASGVPTHSFQSRFVLCHNPFSFGGFENSGMKGNKKSILSQRLSPLLGDEGLHPHITTSVLTRNLGKPMVGNFVRRLGLHLYRFVDIFFQVVFD